MKYLVFIIAISILSFSCNKNAAGSKEVEIYLLKTYQPVVGKCQVDAVTAILEDMPAIRNNEIVAYSKNEYWFELTNRECKRPKHLGMAMLSL